MAAMTAYTRADLDRFAKEVTQELKAEYGRSLKFKEWKIVIGEGKFILLTIADYKGSTVTHRTAL